MLNEIALKDKKWRSYALSLTKNKPDADDLVQEMYLKLSDNKKQINDFYVIIVIRNMFYNNQKRKKYEVCYDDFSFFDNYNNTFEPNDKESLLLEHIKNNVNWWEEELLEMKYHHSYRELAEMYNINYGFVYKTIKRIKKDIKNKYNG